MSHNAVQVTAFHLQPENYAAGLAQCCKAAADPLRLDILRLLKEDSYSVQELCALLQLAQPKLSHHLKVLTGAGLITRRREGNNLFYRRPLITAEQPYADFTDSLYRHIDAQPLSREQQRRITEVQTSRAAASHEFFARHAAEFSGQQALIVELDHYRDNMDALIAHLPIQSRVLEVGPGEGEYLLQLAQHFDHIIALDNSPEMLERAKNHSHSVHNIDFVLGDPERAIALKLQADLIVCNMVLHHLSSPATFFQHSAQLLTAGGHLLLAELCQHDQDWVADSCGDLWQGFSPEQIRHWAGNAGFGQSREIFLGLRNGFQVQLHLYQLQQGI